MKIDMSQINDTITSLQTLRGFLKRHFTPSVLMSRAYYCVAAPIVGMRNGMDEARINTNSMMLNSEDVTQSGRTLARACIDDAQRKINRRTKWLKKLWSGPDVS